MSVDILFKSYGVKVGENKMLVFGEIGSNNSFDLYGKIARSTTLINFYYGETRQVVNLETFASELDEDFEKKIAKSLENGSTLSEADKNDYSYFYGLYNKRSTQSYTRKGIKLLMNKLYKEALTIEEYLDLGVTFQTTKGDYIKTTEQLLEVFFNNEWFNVYGTFRIDNKRKEIRNFKQKEKTLIETDKHYQIKIYKVIDDEKVYLGHYKKGTLKTTFYYTIYNGKRFPTLALANKDAKKFEGSKQYLAEVVEYNEGMSYYK